MCYENTKELLHLILRHIREGNSGYIIDEKILNISKILS